MIAVWIMVGLADVIVIVILVLIIQCHIFSNIRAQLQQFCLSSLALCLDILLELLAFL
jgi:hypothetical protein